jgi:hypothetical protein
MRFRTYREIRIDFEFASPTVALARTHSLFSICRIRECALTYLCSCSREREPSSSILKGIYTQRNTMHEERSASRVGRLPTSIPLLFWVGNGSSGTSTQIRFSTCWRPSSSMEECERTGLKETLLSPEGQAEQKRLIGASVTKRQQHIY